MNAIDWTVFFLLNPKAHGFVPPLLGPSRQIVGWREREWQYHQEHDLRAAAKREAQVTSRKKPTLTNDFLFK